MEETLLKKQELALNQGKAFNEALSLMKQLDTHVEQMTDEYIITVACEAAEGMYVVQPQGDLQWNIPKSDENLHVEIVVQDKEDLRFIPYLTVHMVITNERSTEVISTSVPFIWHPFLYHYGSNIHIGNKGRYSIGITIDAPSFSRHDENKGNRYNNKVTVNFPPIVLHPKRKEYGSE